MSDREKAIEIIAIRLWQHYGQQTNNPRIVNYRIFDNWSEESRWIQADFRGCATAALDALLEMLPTEEMVETFYKAHREDVLAGNIYRLENVRVGLTAALNTLKGDE